MHNLNHIWNVRKYNDEKDEFKYFKLNFRSSGLGVGGGSLFVLIQIMAKKQDLNQIRAYNLAMFISLGIVLAIKNKNEIKELKINKFSILVFAAIGSIIGAKIGNKINENITKRIFNIFMLIIGFYEIIVSLKRIKNGKNNNVKGDK